jgi:hypothetical protein
MKQYKTTEEECRKQIHGVCSGCGGPIEALETVDNSGAPTFWAGCRNTCQCFDYGVPEEIYRTAYRLVTERYHQPYSDMKSEEGGGERYNYWLRSQVRGEVKIVMDVLKMRESVAAEYQRATQKVTP